MVERIIREHGEDVIRLLASMLYTTDRHEDALDCFSRAAQIFCEKHSMGLTPPEDDLDSLVGYLYNCAKNVAREENARYLRHRRLLEENVDEIRDNLFQDEAYRREKVEAVETLFEFFGNFLAERELRIMALRYREGLSFERIAEELGLEPANV
ncbi:MAG TPA: sigma-70 family RNA polymerase sigma factor, partial [Candidatus Krumholzibacterium sp.]|nr:sigma-70 family RNA polymerase sigma factor [Candidatus Krumholzibacterium sp.]